MAVDSLQKILYAVAESITVLMIIAALLWQLYCCFYQLRLRRRRRRRRRCYLSPSSDHIPYPPSPAHSPLHPSPVKLLPTVIYSGADEHSDPPPECAICLTEFKEGDIRPLLPKCDHFFHIDCIDKWLQSNRICPLCRKVVYPPPKITSRRENTEGSAGEEGQIENSSTNVNLPLPIWCPGNILQMIGLEAVAVDIPEEDNRRRQRQRQS